MASAPAAPPLLLLLLLLLLFAYLVISLCDCLFCVLLLMDEMAAVAWFACVDSDEDEEDDVGPTADEPLASPIGSK